MSKKSPQVSGRTVLISQCWQVLMPERTAALDTHLAWSAPLQESEEVRLELASPWLITEAAERQAYNVSVECRYLLAAALDAEGQLLKMRTLNRRLFSGDAGSSSPEHLLVSRLFTGEKVPVIGGMVLFAWLPEPYRQEEDVRLLRVWLGGTDTAPAAPEQTKRFRRLGHWRVGKK